ncbi:MAG: hypothetical protein HZB39_06485 [Planctomycetes bacterium]|nr:hypothetical protein [Planctomycetota bacterium]
MQTQIWTALGLSAGAVEFSQPVNMAGSNALSLTITVFSGALAAAGVEVFESNDLENWKSKGSTFASQSVGASMTVSGFGSIASTYVRFKVTAGAAATVMAMTINTAHL